MRRESTRRPGATLRSPPAGRRRRTTGTPRSSLPGTRAASPPDPPPHRKSLERRPLDHRSQGLGRRYVRPMQLGKDGKVELIRKVPLFSRLSTKRLREIAALADEVDVPAGKVL